MERWYQGGTNCPCPAPKYGCCPVEAEAVGLLWKGPPLHPPKGGSPCLPRQRWRSWAAPPPHPPPRPSPPVCASSSCSGTTPSPGEIGEGLVLRPSFLEQYLHIGRWQVLCVVVVSDHRWCLSIQKIQKIKVYKYNRNGLK